ncbi:MAG: MFS transporter [Bdellovibrionales bacterium]
MSSQFSLMKTKRFLPLFIVQFLGAFNDNLLKTILVVLIAYGLWDVQGMEPGVLVAVATGLFILPFILFSPLAGMMCDKFDKSVMIKWIKLAEVIIAIIAVAALFSENLYFAFVALLLLGTQSAFFSPCKFSILPDHLKKHELIGGNALVSTGTYMAILFGTIFGAALALMDHGKLIGGGIILSMSLIGYLSALKIPSAPSQDSNIKLSFNIVAKAFAVVKFALEQKSGVLISIIGVSYFYFVAATFHAQFPNFTKQSLGADNVVLILFMVAFSVGVAVGGLLNHKFLGARAHGGLVPVSCVFMGVFGIDIYFATTAYPTGNGDALHDVRVFFSNIHGVRLMVDTFLQAVACGFFVIPLRAIVQERSQKEVRSRVISSSNMMDAVFILVSSVISTFILSQGVSIEGLYLFVSVVTVLFGLFLFFVPSLRANHNH